MKKPPTARWCAAKRRYAPAFTLVELMVAMTVLLIIGVLMAQIISATSQTTVLSNRNVDAAAQSRIAFERIHADVAAWLRRSDVDCILQNPSPGATPVVPSMQFFSAIASSGITPRSNNRSISMVAYEMAPHSDNADLAKVARLCLVRAGMPIPWEARPYVLNGVSVNWGSASFMGIKSNGLPVRMDDPGTFFPASLLPKASSATTAGDFDVLSAGVIRMVVGFQLYPDSGNVRLAGGTADVDTKGQIVYSPPIRRMTPTTGVPTPVEYVDIGYIASVVVGVVAIDSENLRTLTAANVADLASAFPLPSDGELPVKKWNTIAGNASSFPNSVPLPARQSLRVYQRAYPLNPSGQIGY